MFHGKSMCVCVLHLLYSFICWWALGVLPLSWLFWLVLHEHRGAHNFFIILFFFLAVLGLHCCAGFSLIAVSGGYSPVVVRGRLLAVACLVVGHRLWGVQASVAAVQRLNSSSSSKLQSTGSVVMAHGLSCSAACGIFPDQVLNMSHALSGGSFTTEPPGKPTYNFLN